jgi:opacity protein-like surface antigen
MKKRALILIALALAACLAAAPAAAGGRWMLGLDGLSSNIQDNNEEDNISVEEKAGGVGFHVGYRFSPSFMLRLYGGSADHATTNPDVDIRFGSGLLELAYLFREGQAFRPYLFGGAGGFTLESQQESLLFKAEGAGVSFGGGVNYHVSKTISLHGSLRLEAVNWSKLSATITLNDGSELAGATPIEDSGFASKATFGVAFWL